MFALVVSILFGVTIIMFFIYLFVSDEPNKNKFIKLNNQKGGIYFVNNLQMNVLNNISQHNGIKPLYNVHSLKGNYTRKKTNIVDSIIN